MLPDTRPISFRRKELLLSKLGTLRSDDGDGNENVKKKLGLIQNKNNNFSLATRLTGNLETTLDNEPQTYNTVSLP